MGSRSLDDLGQSLTDTFCEGMDQRVIQEMIRSRNDAMGARQALAETWGISDAALIDRIAELGLTVEAVAAMSLTPLVAVAWADGNADKRERAAVLQAAEDHGLARQDVSYLLLEGRLGEQPPATLFETWVSYIRLLAEVLEPSVVAALRHDVLDSARAVAAASGGVLGLGSKISQAEADVLEQLELAFG